MRKILFLLLIVGVLMLGIASIGDIGEKTAQGITFSEKDFGDSGGGSTPDGGCQGGEGPAPG